MSKNISLSMWGSRKKLEQLLLHEWKVKWTKIAISTFDECEIKENNGYSWTDD